jgi:DnaJ-class molecular chaperone
MEQAMAGWLQHLVGQFVMPVITPPHAVYPIPLDPYSILGVSPGDPPEMIEAVYRAKVKFLHPDQPTGNADAFIRLQQAYHQIKEHLKNGTTH